MPTILTPQGWVKVAPAPRKKQTMRPERQPFEGPWHIWLVNHSRLPSTSAAAARQRKGTLSVRSERKSGEVETTRPRQHKEYNSLGTGHALEPSTPKTNTTSRSLSLKEYLQNHPGQNSLRDRSRSTGVLDITTTTIIRSPALARARALRSSLPPTDRTLDIDCSKLVLARRRQVQMITIIRHRATITVCPAASSHACPDADAAFEWTEFVLQLVNATTPLNFN